MTSTQRSATSAAWPLPNDYGLELECADVLEHQLEVARQRVHDCKCIINKLRLDMQVLDAGVKKNETRHQGNHEGIGDFAD